MQTLIWNSVDLLKAGTGEFQGEAAATIKNLVSDRINSIELHWDEDPDAYLAEAKERLYKLGDFVLPDEERRSYFRQEVDILAERARKKVFPRHSQLP